jgi:serine/threonine-protein kinase
VAAAFALVPRTAAPAATPPAASAVAASAAVPTVAATVPVGAAPGYMEIAPNGPYAYIASRASGT